MRKLLLLLPLLFLGACSQSTQLIVECISREDDRPPGVKSEWFNRFTIDPKKGIVKEETDSCNPGDKDCFREGTAQVGGRAVSLRIKGHDEVGVYNDYRWQIDLAKGTGTRWTDLILGGQKMGPTLERELTCEVLQEAE